MNGVASLYCIREHTSVPVPRIIAQFYRIQRTLLLADPHGANSWYLLEKPVTRGGHGDEAKREEGGCAIRQAAP